MQLIRNNVCCLSYFPSVLLPGRFFVWYAFFWVVKWCSFFHLLCYQHTGLRIRSRQSEISDVDLASCPASDMGDRLGMAPNFRLIHFKSFWALFQKKNFFLLHRRSASSPTSEMGDQLRIIPNFEFIHFKSFRALLQFFFYSDVDLAPSPTSETVTDSESSQTSDLSISSYLEHFCKKKDGYFFPPTSIWLLAQSRRRATDSESSQT